MRIKQIYPLRQLRNRIGNIYCTTNITYLNASASVKSPFCHCHHQCIEMQHCHVTLPSGNQNMQGWAGWGRRDGSSRRCSVTRTRPRVTFNIRRIQYAWYVSHLVLHGISAAALACIEHRHANEHRTLWSFCGYILSTVIYMSEFLG